MAISNIFQDFRDPAGRLKFSDLVLARMFPGRFRDQQQTAQRERFLGDIDQLRGKLVGNLQPFEQDLFPGEQPIQGLQTGQEGILQPGPSTSLIDALMQSQSPELAQLGLQRAFTDIGAEQQAQAQQAQTSALQQALSGDAPQAIQGLAAIRPQAAIDLFKQQQDLALKREAQNQSLVGATGKQKRTEESTLRGQVNSVTRAFADEQDKARKIIEIGNKTPDKITATDDGALAFMYARLLSPGIVTESDLNAVRAAGGLPAAAEMVFNSMVDGKIPDHIRADIVSASAQILESGRQNMLNAKASFEGIATRGGLNPKNLGFDRFKFEVPELVGKGSVSQLPKNAPPLPPGFRPK